MTGPLRRAWLAMNVAVTLALLPALFPDAGNASEATVDVVDVVDAPTTSTTTAPSTTTTSVAPPSTTTTAAPPAPAVRARAVTTTTVRPPATSTTAAPAPPPPPAAPTPPPATGRESGRATWYDYQPGICAHRTLPFGTVVTVHAVNGRSVQCTVGDRGPFVDGYVIDLHWREFEQLTSRDAGRIDVTITW